MTAAWDSYHVRDFIPFSREVHLRLIERVNDAQWPLQLGFIALGVLAAGFAVRGRPRRALALLAPAWGWTAAVFFLQFYSELTWAGRWFAAGFGLEALFVLTALPWRSAHRETTMRFDPTTVAALLLWGGGVILYPLAAPLSGAGWIQSEVFGVHPAPTALCTLGLLLVSLRGPWLGVCGWIPLLWCLVEGLVLRHFGLPRAWALFLGGLIAIGAILFLSMSGKKINDQAGAQHSDAHPFEHQ